MGIFSIDIERYYQEEAEAGCQLKGIFCIQYPVYCIHSNIIDVTPDALDNLDRVIVDLLSTNPAFSSFQLAGLLGGSRALINLRLNALLADDLIYKENEGFHVTVKGMEVFRRKSQVRHHKRSFDFYIDGLTFKPLPKVYYTYYRSKFISEHDSYFYTNSKGETKIAYPFLPDLVHTPPNKEMIIQGLLGVEEDEREQFNIPRGLESIEDISFTKLSFQVLVSVSVNARNEVKKKLIDGFAIYTLHEPYLETLRKNVGMLEANIAGKIANLEFHILVPRSREDDSKNIKPVLCSNWAEIDNYKDSKNICFSFSKEDLRNVIANIYKIKEVVEESIVNNETQIEISINKQMLLESANRQKLVSDLIRKRDYKFGNVDNGNVFLLYLYYKSDDPFVLEVVKFKQFLNIARSAHSISVKFLQAHQHDFAFSYRELLVAAGEFEILEKLDIEEYMENLQ